MNQVKVKAILDFPEPRKIDHVLSFLGLARYYRQFVHPFSTKTAPLIKLLKKSAQFEWGAEQEEAFKTLKEGITTKLVLAFSDFCKPFCLHTDATGVGLGAVVAQQDDIGRLRLIVYASKAPNDEEKKYNVTHQEALAIAWIIKHLRTLIFGYLTNVCTDHRPCSELF